MFKTLTSQSVRQARAWFSKRTRSAATALATAIGLAIPSHATAAEPTGAGIDFGRDIRPILSDNCFSCHGPDQNRRKAGLRLDVREGALQKLDSGATAVVPGHPEQSRLLQVIALPSSDDDHMPPVKSGKKLTSSQVDLLRRWVAAGARWSEHWAYVAPVRPAVPPTRNRDLARNDVDRFVLAELERHGLKPNPEADRYTLIRRVSLDLIGLPPTIEEVDEFVADREPRAYERLVERLLASPHFGERLALAWLDQARYADTSGYHFDGFRQMHLWRDWVIRAFNDNKPFDQFTIEQLAGDLLPDPTVDQRVATGFQRNVMTNDEGGADPDEYLSKYVADRVTTTAQVWLGTTMGCAECHDHKYDPITTREFYQLYAFFHNVPEKGLDGTRVRNPAPVMKVPSADQGARLLRFLERIPGAEKTLADREAELPGRQAAWEKELQANRGKTTLAPSTGPLSGLLHNFTFDEADSPRTNRAPGVVGSALELRGQTNDIVDLGQRVAFDSTNAFSYGAWVRLNGPSGAVLSKMAAGPGYQGFDLLLSEGKVQVHLVRQFPDNALKIVTKDPVPTNRWVHLMATYDGTSKAGGLKIYVDGQSRSSETATDKLTGTIRTTAPLLLGGRLNFAPLSGSIDDVRFYSRRLDAAEVAALAADAPVAIARQPQNTRTPAQTELLTRHFRENVASEFIEARQRLARLRQDKETLLEQIPDTMVMEESDKPRDTFILVRGDFQNHGDKVKPGTPACWPPLPAGPPTNRLALARWLVATNQPLTARVIANRYWAMLFGTGLVKTGNDFGSQGERPSHPQLLDWLACEFMQPMSDPSVAAGSAGDPPHAWDVKHLWRLLVTSATYRQSAAVSTAKLERDPYNRLLSRGPRLRLDAELIRDNALAVSGLLNPSIGGPSIKPYQPPGIWDGTDHKYEQSKGADLYRRGMYVFWKRAAHYPSFQTFDAPSRETCTVQRPRTSTPLQSLVVMNDPVYVEASRALASRVLLTANLDLEQRLTLAFRLTLARPPERAERRTLLRTFEEQRAAFAADPKAAKELLGVGESPCPAGLDPIELAAMTGVANVLLNLNETITH